MLRHRSGRVLEMGSVHVMFSVLVYSISVQRVGANFRIDLSRRLRTVRRSIPLFTDALRMCSLTSRVVLTLRLAPHASA